MALRDFFFFLVMGEVKSKSEEARSRKAFRDRVGQTADAE